MLDESSIESNQDQIRNMILPDNFKDLSLLAASNKFYAVINYEGGARIAVFNDAKGEVIMEDFQGGQLDEPGQFMDGVATLNNKDTVVIYSGSTFYSIPMDQKILGKTIQIYIFRQ